VQRDCAAAVDSPRRRSKPGQENRLLSTIKLHFHTQKLCNAQFLCGEFFEIFQSVRERCRIPPRAICATGVINLYVFVRFPLRLGTVPVYPENATEGGIPSRPVWGFAKVAFADAGVSDKARSDG
jgi:hypothetical protein